MTTEELRRMSVRTGVLQEQAEVNALVQAAR